ncbi:MAG: glutamate-5-semialdehyde dehydrogenase [Deltaproteobacteria bacterium]|nr:glutamate-5-semialdehyde dehydrogenase [Deltaproteobacteria bacterium]MBK7069636.1 glutamate-5-semialdehyde dehydrogenase [Deltaproteobacteria bacterium]MBK8692028.1 glutamate-5-semialdehyde dehydrogenase [Deltaproteobacteria bacterium]MBP6833965.1 glutamate-5-semialdehyde dehydrogenase [Deltaproteobacteria bacterium]
MATLDGLLSDARTAQRSLARSTASERTAAIESVARSLDAHRDAILAANAEDLRLAPESLGAAMRDRLALTPSRLDGVIAAVREVAAMPDPLDEERSLGTRPNGLQIARRRIPLGVIAVIYEARPNVTAESAALTLRSGNAVVLRGGSEALRSNAALATAVRAGLSASGLDPNAVSLVTDPDRARVTELLQATGRVDLAIPRGGPALMAFVDANARVPVIRHGAGVCHVYVDRAAELPMAEAITVNAKVQRPGVCNAAETLLVHRAVADALLPSLGRRLHAAGVELRADEAAREVLRRADVPSVAATPEDWDTEYLGLVLAVRVVDDLDAAMAHIARHGTEHSAAIVTADAEAGERFLREVTASCVLLNASTRFNDGGELGLGAEIGISTSRMHAFGPMSARELTTEKFVVRGSGQVRGSV